MAIVTRLPSDGICATQIGDMMRRTKTHKPMDDGERERPHEWRGWVLVESLGWYEAVNDARHVRVRVCGANRLAREGGTPPSKVVLMFRQVVDRIDGEMEGKA